MQLSGPHSAMGSLLQSSLNLDEALARSLTPMPYTNVEAEMLIQSGRAEQAMAVLDRPIRQMVEQAESLKELKEMLLNAYTGMDDSDLTRLLEETLGVAALHGVAAAAQSRRRRR